jgi:hypothetical protein
MTEAEKLRIIHESSGIYTQERNPTYLWELIKWVTQGCPRFINGTWGQVQLQELEEHYTLCYLYVNDGWEVELRQCLTLESALIEAVVELIQDYQKNGGEDEE